MKFTTSSRHNSLITIVIYHMISVFLFIFNVAEGQQRQPYSIEQVKESNFWLYGQNPAGLVFGIPDRFSIIEGTYGWQQNGLKQVFEPQSKHTYKIEIQSFQQLRKSALYGKASYSGEIRNRQQWTAMFHPSTHAILFGDSIPGQITGESYLLTGSIAVPVGRHWTLGVTGNWQMSNRGKDTDPRSLNNNTQLYLMPGIALTTGNLKVGLNTIWQKKDEDISYISIGEETKNGRTYYPLWFYKEETFTESSNQYRYYRQQIAGVAIQLGYKRKNWITFCEADYKWGNEQVEINRSTRLSAGESENHEYHFQNHTMYTNRHTFTLSVNRKKRTDYNLQQQLPQGKLVYETTHRVKRSEQTLLTTSLAYEFHSIIPCWKISLSIATERRKTLFLIYPAKFSQDFSNHVYTARYARHTKCKKHLFDYGATLNIFGGSGNSLSVTTSDNAPFPEITLRQNTMLLTQEYDYLTASRTKFLLHFQYTHLFPTVALYTRLNSDYEQFSSRIFSSHPQNYNICLLAGILF